MGKTILMHIDLNAFFATAETIAHPEYQGKPLVVAGLDRRGIVSTANYEARKYGIHSAMPTYQAMRLCPSLIVCPPHFSLYSRLSKEFFAFVRNYSPLIEVASIDECYVDMTIPLTNCKDVPGYLKEMQQALFDKTGLGCSIGIAKTKFLAKMGSDMKKPMGITIIRNRDIPSMIYPLPIQSMFGIGKKTAPKLEKLGVKKIGDLLTFPPETLKEVMGKFYYTAMDWLKGKGDDQIDMSEWNPKSVGRSRTLLYDTNDSEEILEMVRHLCHMVSDDMKEEEKYGTVVTLSWKDRDFRMHSKSVTIEEPIQDYLPLFQIAKKLTTYIPSTLWIRLIGVSVSGLLDPKEMIVQMTLFNYEEHEEKAQTKLIISDVNRKMKKDLLFRASELKKKGKEKKK